MADDKRSSGQTTSAAFQYRREQVAKQMAGMYTVFGTASSHSKTAASAQQSQTSGKGQRKD